jgi:hypothetical protein
VYENWLFTPMEVARHLRIDEERVLDYVAKGELVAVILPGHPPLVRIVPRYLRAFLRAHQRPRMTSSVGLMPSRTARARDERNDVTERP